ncbi:serine/threonine-protein phosphatase 6 regulatory subunit 3 isoform X2 [Stomoxys calcitrans]|uniref:Uncharacterized protein n=1 Tax=Stomoxys calcitrans TaxID=35570 RepID=A0A1I8PGC4_STOCA|nr:serine/threonine-protein phosphatase 6 regulatory subunit 3 isoform X2 [Stomoxys calcitrans]XP_059219384.1 serine/threonine-protein phosphatase 6 regulatory subunit 3 isoform X2 [Stomoxys calcitrans]
MFWDKNDSPSQNIEALLEKENVTVEEFLEEDDIIQECKTYKKCIVNYFTRPDVIKRMIELITTEPAEDLPLALRFRHANVACEILLLGLPSLDEKLISDEDTLKMLYSYLENEPPLNPLLASFFSKTFSMLFTKKSDQDWFLYQQLCLKLMEFLKTQNNFLDLMCKHFSTPVIPDIIVELMRNVEGAQLKRSMYEWLNEERLVEKLIDIIGDPEQSDKHVNVAEFLCDLIHQGRTMRQTENDTFEPIFKVSNPILKSIESATTLFALFNVILQPNALESAIVSGITVVLKVIKMVSVMDERDDRWLYIQAREQKVHDEFLTTVMRVIEPQLKSFNELLRNPPKKDDIITSAAVLSPPFGMTRLQVCRIFTVLLETKNEEITKAICATDFFDILLSLFKQYSWNNFLHSEVEKCIHIAFKSTNLKKPKPKTGTEPETIENMLDDIVDIEFNFMNESEVKERDQNGEILPSAIQTHLIVNCRLISRLIECWTLNRENETEKKGRRLGYMGHLIKICKHISECITESKHIGALVDSNLKDDTERELWKSIVDSTDGELTQALKIQSKLLANCEASDYDVSLDFLTDNDFSDAFNNLCAVTDSMDTDFLFTLDYNTQHDSDDDDGGDGNDSDDHNENSNDDEGQDNQQVTNALNLFQFGRSNDDDDDDEEDNGTSGDVLSFDAKLKLFTATSNPWDTNDELYIFKSSPSLAWPQEASTTDNFADFDAHFSSFANDMSDSLTGATSGTTPAASNDNIGDCPTPRPEDSTGNNFTNAPATSATTSEEYDNNANVEKLAWPGELSSFHSRQTFVDDYEDDDGMWTKPLGGASAENDVPEEEEKEKKDADKITTCDDEDNVDGKMENTSALTNGPTKSTEDEPVTAIDNEEKKAETNQLNSSENEQPAQEDDNNTNITTSKEENVDKEVNDVNKDINNEEEELINKHKSITIETESNVKDTKETTAAAAVITTALTTTSTDNSTTLSHT